MLTTRIASCLQGTRSGGLGAVYENCPVLLPNERETKTGHVSSTIHGTKENSPKNSSKSNWNFRGVLSGWKDVFLEANNTLVMGRPQRAWGS